MNYECPKCSETINDDFNFCPNCGEDILIKDNTIYLEEYYNSYINNENKIKQQEKEIRDNERKITELKNNTTKHENTLKSLKEKIDNETSKIRKLENKLKEDEIESLFNDIINKKEENKTENPANKVNYEKIEINGKININTADIDELKKIPGFDLNSINKLLQLRRNGNYIRSFDDLEHKLGIKSYHVSLIKEYVTIENDNYNDNNLNDGRFIDL